MTFVVVVYCEDRNVVMSHRHQLGATSKYKIPSFHCKWRSFVVASLLQLFDSTFFAPTASQPTWLYRKKMIMKTSFSLATLLMTCPSLKNVKEIFAIVIGDEHHHNQHSMCAWCVEDLMRPSPHFPHGWRWKYSLSSWATSSQSTKPQFSFQFCFSTSTRKSTKQNNSNNSQCRTSRVILTSSMCEI